MTHRRWPVYGPSELLCAKLLLHHSSSIKIGDGFGTLGACFPALVSSTAIIIALARLHAKTLFRGARRAEAIGQAHLGRVAIIARRATESVFCQGIAGHGEEACRKEPNANGVIRAGGHVAANDSAITIHLGGVTDTVPQGGAFDVGGTGVSDGRPATGGDP
jgi:hypothetical protein